MIKFYYRFSDTNNGNDLLRLVVNIVVSNLVWIER
jgi:hypothetical protein